MNASSEPQNLAPLPKKSFSIPLRRFSYCKKEVTVSFEYLPEQLLLVSWEMDADAMRRDSAYICFDVNASIGRRRHYFSVEDMDTLNAIIQADQEGKLDRGLKEIVQREHWETLDKISANIEREQCKCKYFQAVREGKMGRNMLRYYGLDENQSPEEAVKYWKGVLRDKKKKLLEQMKESYKPIQVFESCYSEDAAGRASSFSRAALFYTPRTTKGEPKERKWTISIRQVYMKPEYAMNEEYAPTADSRAAICLTTDGLYDILNMCNRAIERWLRGEPMERLVP